MSDEHKEFKIICAQEINEMSSNKYLKALTRNWMNAANLHKYSYHFDWLGRPIIQYPQDIITMQQIIWEVKPDLVIETGIARGGSLIFSASMLALLDMFDAMKEKKYIDPEQSGRRVLGIDIDIRAHNREAIEAHPLGSRIQMIQGSSIDPAVIQEIQQIVLKYKTVLVCLDSNHTHEHVLSELEAYAPLVTKGSYCCVFDTVIDDMPKEMFPNRPWGPGNNPKTAVKEYLSRHPEYEIDQSKQDAILITVAPEGYLKRLR